MQDRVFRLNRPNLDWGGYTTILKILYLVKFMFSKKATKIDKIFTVDLTVTTYCQIDSEDFCQFLWPSQKM